MNDLYKYIVVCIVILTVCLTSCKDEEGKAPSVQLDTMNFRSEAGEGCIILRWDTPEKNPGYMYMKMEYTDPREKKFHSISVSSYSDSLVIDNTRARYGDAYSFKFTPYSENDIPGSSFVLEKCKSGPAKKTVSIERVDIKLTINSLYTNAQEPTEGPLNNLIDGNKSTFFHTTWSGDGPDGPHWVDVDFGEKVDRFEIYTCNRDDGNSYPIEVKLYSISSPGDSNVDMEHPMATYIPEKNESGAENIFMFPALDTPSLSVPIHGFRYCARSSDAVFWNLAELAVRKVSTNSYDPEVDEIPVYDK